ncbi:asp/Glu/hydantoin racemase [Alistipes sp. CAG:831]|nr:asp/Glu/hydantoin racemase [Alistipes sp. CAG:831]
MLPGRFIYHAAVLAAAAVLLSVSSCGDRNRSNGLLPIAQKALGDSSSIYYADFPEYPRELSDLPIGIFDCSPDGFTVAERFLTADNFDNITGRSGSDGIADFGGEYFQILYDRANSPYGGYIDAGNPAFLKEQLIRNTLFLMSDRYYNLAVDEYQSGYKDPVKIVIVPSPVADYYALSDIQALLDRSGTGVKAVGVIESSIREALKGVDEDGNFCVGVLYSPEGVTSREYEAAIRKMASDSGVTGRIQVFNQEGLGIEEALAGNPAYLDTSAKVSRSGYAGPVTGISYNNINASLFDRYGFDTVGNALLFPAGGRNISGVQLNSVENYVRYHLVSMVERHRRSGSRVPISSIILADCGYDRLRGVMDRIMVELYNYRRGGIYLYRSSISPDFRFIDPAECAVSEAYRILREDGNLALRGTKSTLSPFITMPSSSVPADSLDSSGFFRETFLFGRVSGTEDVTTKAVPFTPRYIDAEELGEIEYNHETFTLIRNALY